MLVVRPSIFAFDAGTACAGCKGAFGHALYAFVPIRFLLPRNRVDDAPGEHLRCSRVETLQCHPSSQPPDCCPAVDGHGRGVFATRALVPGELVCECLGERISWEEALRRHPRDPAHSDHAFYLDTGDGTVNNGAVGGNGARWINHACRPNCETEDRNGRIFVLTVQPIRTGKEPSIDYAPFVEGRHTRQFRERYACHCDAPDCRGTMLAKRGKRSRYEHISAPNRRLVKDSVHTDVAARAGIHIRTTIADTLSGG